MCRPRCPVLRMSACSPAAPVPASDCFFRFTMMAASCGSIARDRNTRWRLVCFRAARGASRPLPVRNVGPAGRPRANPAGSAPKYCLKFVSNSAVRERGSLVLT